MPFRIEKGLHQYDIVYFIKEELSQTVWPWQRRKSPGGKGAVTE